jgi:hypothetical protein
MPRIEEFKDIIKSCNVLLNESKENMRSLGITVYIGNQFTTYFIDPNFINPKLEKIIVKIQQIFNPITNQFDITRTEISPPDTIEFIDNELIPPGYQIWKIFINFNLKNSLEPEKYAEMRYFVYKDHKLFYGCDENVIKRKLELYYNIMKIKEQVTSLETLIKLTKEIKENEGKINDIENKLKEARSQQPDTNKMMLALESFIKNNEGLTNVNVPEVKVVEPRRSGRTKYIPGMYKFNFGNAVFPELDELLTDESWHQCHSENQLNNKLDYIYRNLDQEFKKLESEYPDIKFKDYFRIQDKLIEVTQRLLRLLTNLKQVVDQNKQSQIDIDILAKNLVKAKYSKTNQNIRPKAQRALFNQEYNITIPSYDPNFGKSRSRLTLKQINKLIKEINLI